MQSEIKQLFLNSEWQGDQPRFRSKRRKEENGRVGKFFSSKPRRNDWKLQFAWCNGSWWSRQWRPVFSYEVRWSGQPSDCKRDERGGLEGEGNFVLEKYQRFRSSARTFSLQAFVWWAKRRWTKSTANIIWWWVWDEILNLIFFAGWLRQEKFLYFICMILKCGI